MCTKFILSNLEDISSGLAALELNYNYFRFWLTVRQPEVVLHHLAAPQKQLRDLHRAIRASAGHIQRRMVCSGPTGSNEFPDPGFVFELHRIRGSICNCFDVLREVSVDFVFCCITNDITRQKVWHSISSESCMKIICTFAEIWNNLQVCDWRLVCYIGIWSATGVWLVRVLEASHPLWRWPFEIRHITMGAFTNHILGKVTILPHR